MHGERIKKKKIRLLNKEAGTLTYLNDMKIAHQLFVDGQHCTCVVELTTVVGRREYGDQLASREELVSILHHLNKP